MVNGVQLDIINKGVSIWNEWKRENADAEIIQEIDLSNANLSQVYLRNADLSGVDLSGANLWGADLLQANLSGANLRDADLSRANLLGANLSNTILWMAHLRKANLYGANLKEANLSNVDLSRANLGRANLKGANLSNADLNRVNLNDADLSSANLSGADLSNAELKQTYLLGANLHVANLNGANLSKADLSNANDLIMAILIGANLSEANLSNADLRLANLSKANMVETNLNKTNLTGCRIYGVSAWDLKLQDTIQKDLIITRYGESTITVDNLEVAQFVYLLLKNEKIRDVINTIGKKGVLILGRFTPIERMAILDEIRGKLRQLGYVPMVFDFERPTDKDFTETIMILAGMSRFVIADITNPKSSPLELQATVPNYKIPFIPIIQKGEEPLKPFAMLKDLKEKYPWVLDLLAYDSISDLMGGFEKAIIERAEEKHNQLVAEKAEELRIIDIKDYQ